MSCDSVAGSRSQVPQAVAACAVRRKVYQLNAVQTDNAVPRKAGVKQTG